MFAGVYSNQFHEKRKQLKRRYGIEMLCRVYVMVAEDEKLACRTEKLCGFMGN